MDFLTNSAYWIVPLIVTLGFILLIRMTTPAFTRRTVFCIVPLGFAAMVTWAGYDNYRRPGINVTEIKPVTNPEPIDAHSETKRNYGFRITCTEPLISSKHVDSLVGEWFGKQDNLWFAQPGEPPAGDQVARPEGYNASKLYAVKPVEPGTNGLYKEVELYVGFVKETPVDSGQALEALSAFLTSQLNYTRFNFNLGVDLAGGSILVYEVDKKWWSEQTEEFRANFDSTKLASIIKRRLDPSNLLEIAVRPVRTEPPRVEIILPIRSGKGGQSEAEIAAVKNKVTRIGQLLFRLAADNRDGTKTPDDITAIEEARNGFQNWTPKDIDDSPNEAKGEDGKLLLPRGYRWYELDRRMVRQMGSVPLAEKFTTSWGSHRSLLFMHHGEKHWMLLREPAENDPANVTGGDLSSARPDYQNGNWVVLFQMTGSGASKLYALTEPVEHYLAILLDGKVVSAPILQARLSDGGIIQMGRGDDVKREVDELATILQAGSLPAKLSQKPVSELSMGPSLGQDTIDKGTWAVVWAFVAVVSFMIVYYRLAGIVASIALFANLLLTIAFMVTFKAAFTLPGLAGLVLMLGMAVDSNVLIYERLREERERGGSLTLSLRNAYNLSFPTIIDTHLTSIFTGIVLYAVGNDQLKGFGISLTVGLIISLFTSLYMTRYLFDLFLAKGWMRELRMMKMLSRPNIDFMKSRNFWFAATGTVSILGLVLLLARGESAMNIDFTGGTAYGFQFKQPKPIGEVRKALENPSLPAEHQLPEPAVDETRELGPDGKEIQSYLIRTTEKDRDRVRDAVVFIFKKDLLMIEPSASEITQTEDGKHQVTFTFKNQRFASDDLKKTASDWFAAREYSGDPLLLLSVVDPKDPGKGKGKDKDKDTGLYGAMTLVFSLPESLSGREKDLVDYMVKQYDAPVSNRLENFDSQLAGETRMRALYAIVLSWLAIIMYLWFRFGSWRFGVAAVLCLIHGLLFTLGLICVASLLAVHTPIGAWFMFDDFKIDLPAVAALLTVVGYAVNDTIVIFDRIREVRGKSPELTPKMINDAVNQCLSRTLLTGISVFLVLFILYIFGGPGVHLFSFIMIVGVASGTYGSIYVASPLLLIFGEGAKVARVGRQQPQELAV